jgi:signal transduction histidine kinase
MWPTGPVPRWRATDGPGAAPVGPALTTLRSVIAYLASMIRCAGIAYIVAEVVLWHSFYVASAWRLIAPAVAVAWAVTVVAYLRGRPLAPLFACADSVFYVALALGAQACVPPAVRDGAFSWVVIAMSGQLIVPAWGAPRVLSVFIAAASPLAYWVGASLQPVTDRRMMTGAAILLLVIGLVHGYGRRTLYRRAAVADAEVDEADRAVREQYAILCGNIARREHERLVHDTVLNTLTAVARGSGDAAAGVVTRCRQDVALIEAALGGADDPDSDDAAADGLLSEVRAVVGDMRARGLTVHLEGSEQGLVVPARVTTAISGAVREALSNVAAHAGTGEAWVTVRAAAPEDPGLLTVVVRDQGAGFDPDRADRSRLGLRRSIAERTAECGGHAAVWSVPGQGTEVSLTWPSADPSGDFRPGHGLVRPGPGW